MMIDESHSWDFVTNKKKFFAAPFYKYRKAKSRFVILYGGSNSSKSFSVHQSELLNLPKAKTDTLFIRKHGSDIYDSCYKLLENIANGWKKVKTDGSEWSFHDEFTWNFSNQKREIKYEETGKRILFRGIDDSEKLKSIAGIGRIVIEEANQLDIEDFKELNRRARGVENIQIVLIFNPVHKDHWLKKHFFDTPEVAIKCDHLHFTIEDNKFATKEDIDELDSLQFIDIVDYEVYRLGLWGEPKTGGEYYSNFDKAKHVKNIAYNPSLPIHLCFDFNVLPYITMICCQIEQTSTKLTFNFFKEYCLKNPFNSVEGTHARFKEDFDEYKPMCFYYGDSTGKNRMSGLGDFTNYGQIEDFFIKYLHSDSDRVLRRNPNPLKRRTLLQKIFNGGEYDVEIVMDESCTELIKDFQTLKMGPNGKIKTKFHDKVLGATYELVGHTSDAAEGLLCQILYDML